MTLIKICGLSDLKATQAADEADFAGFIVGSPHSHRNISLDNFLRLRDELTHAQPVLVTVNPSIKFLHKLQNIPNVIIQLHGQARQFSDFMHKTALGMDLCEFENSEYNDKNHYSFLSIDSINKHGYGGSGESWTWKSLQPRGEPLLVAGGISTANVEYALQQTHAQGVDVSSSLERQGKKDPELIQEFIARVRAL